MTAGAAAGINLSTSHIKANGWYVIDQTIQVSVMTFHIEGETGTAASSAGYEHQDHRLAKFCRW